MTIAKEQVQRYLDASIHVPDNSLIYGTRVIYANTKPVTLVATPWD